jgi:hypothetical protein
MISKLGWVYILYDNNNKPLRERERERENEVIIGERMRNF